MHVYHCISPGIYFFLFIYSHVHTLFGSFLLPVPLPHPLPPFPPSVLPLSLILLKKRHKHNKEDKAFLLVELRIAIQRNSYYSFHVPMCYDPCWFNSNWSLCWFLIPFSCCLCHFKIFVLVPLEWTLEVSFKYSSF
jgi:hypothetical protein